MLRELLYPFREHLPREGSTELRAQKNTSRGVSLLAGNLVGNVRSDVSGVSARSRVGGRCGFASTAELDPGAAEKVLRAARDNAGFLSAQLGPAEKPLSPLRGGEIHRAAPWNDAEQKTYIDFLRELDDYVAKLPHLSSRALVVRADSREIALLNSEGVFASSATPRCYVYLNLNSETPEGSPVELFKALGGFGGFDDHFSDPRLLFPAVDALHARLMEKREGVYAKAGKKTCILGGELSGMLAHEAVGHTVEADLVLGGSVAGPNLHKTVASPLMNMTDFAHTAFGGTAPLPVYVDEEGVTAQDAPLIRDGVLVGYMHNRESAAHFGMEALGNARAYSFSDEPLIRMRNTAVHPGQDRLEDMIASVEDGYYLLETNNGQADSTGEFMFGVTMGYEIKGGRLGKAILDTTISGVAFEMLKTVDMVSGEMAWSSSGYCGKKQMMPVGLGGPALRCQVMIGGR